MKNLISITDFVLNVPISGMEVQSLGIQGNNRYQRCIKYANFLKQPLSIEMFVPCELVEGVWVVLKEPKEEDFDLEDMYDWNLYYDYKKEYQEAKERCLFEGFEIDYENIVKSKHVMIWFKSKLEIFINSTNEKVFTIEDLVKHKPVLTATAKKMIEL